MFVAALKLPSAGNLVTLLVGAAMVALFFALSVFIQNGLDYNALATGLSQIPLAGALVVIAGIAPTLIGRFGARATLSGSLIVMAGGLVWLAFAPADAQFVAHLVGPTLLIGIRLGRAFVSATQLAVTGVDSGEAGLAGGLVNTSQQVGGGSRVDGNRVCSALQLARPQPPGLRHTSFEKE